MYKNLDSGMVVRTILMVIALVNQGLIMAGYTPLPVDEEHMYEFFSMAFVAITTIWNWWKNNNLTPEAKQAQAELDRMRVNKKYTRMNGNYGSEQEDVKDSNGMGGTL